MRKQFVKAEIITNKPSETESVAGQLARTFPDGGIFCLYGDLGTGKTVFSKGFAKAVGIGRERIKSPTYTLQRSYQSNNGTLHHFDFYRLETPDDLLAFEVGEIFYQKNAWIIIEWADRIQELLPENRTDIYFSYLGENQRKIEIL